MKDIKQRGVSYVALYDWIMSHILLANDAGGSQWIEKNNNAVVAPNGAFYFIRSEALREEKTFFPRNTLPLMMDEEASLDIDTPFDWSIAELILEKNLHVGQSP